MDAQITPGRYLLGNTLTVFRDQEFSADMQSRAVVRIHEIRDLRNRQFP